MTIYGATKEVGVDGRDISTFLFHLVQPESQQLLRSGSFNSISFTFNDMIIHISRPFQIITVFHSLFSPYQPPPPKNNVLPHSTSLAPYFFPLPLSLNFHIDFFHLMAIIENAFHRKQCIIIRRQDKERSDGAIFKMVQDIKFLFCG